MVSQLVLATDDSPSAHVAEDMLVSWPIFDRLPVGVVSVADAVRPWTSGIAPMFQRQALDAYSQDLEDATQAAEHAANEAAARIRAAGRAANATVRRGDPATEIIAFAAERSADLVVLGSRGRSALVEIVLGSVARNVLAGTDASVLIVPSPDGPR